MNIQQLKYIVAIDRLRSFARAADACNISQPTLSAMLAKLEEELDVRIFDRTNKVVKPTSAGEKIIRQARKVLMEASPHWASQSAFTAFDTVRMVEALSIATSLVGVELHRANAGAHLTFLSAIITDLNATVTIRKMSAFRCHP